MKSILFVPAVLAAAMVLGGCGEEIREDRPLAGDQVRAAESVFGLEFTRQERELMQEDLEEQRRSFAALRRNLPDNSVRPAIRFDPQLAWAGRPRLHRYDTALVGGQAVWGEFPYVNRPDHLETLADYLPRSSSIVLTLDARPAATQIWSEILARYEQLRHDIERPCLPPADLFIDDQELARLIAEAPSVSLEPFEIESGGVNAGSKTLPPMRVAVRPGQPTGLLEAFLSGFPGRVLFTAESPGRREMLRNLLHDHHVHE